MGGVIFVIPMTFTMALRAPRMEPRTSGYSERHRGEIDMRRRSRKDVE